MRDDDRYRGDGSADREALTRNTEDEASPRAPMPSAAEIEARNAEIKREMMLRSIAGFRAAAEHSPFYCKELYYRAMWRAFRDLHGGDTIRAALSAAAGLDGVQLEEDDDARP